MYYLAGPSTELPPGPAILCCTCLRQWLELAAKLKLDNYPANENKVVFADDAAWCDHFGHRLQDFRLRDAFNAAMRNWPDDFEWHDILGTAFNDKQD